MSNAQQPAVDQIVPDRRKRIIILLICSMSLLIVGIDVTIVNVALPAIHHSLHAGLSGLQWTVDAYTLVLASLLIFSGSMADRLGRRRIFQLGLALFVLGSLLCALAPSLGFLIVARVLQAVGGSMLNPVALSIIRNVFTDSRERAQAIGIWGGVIGISIALGPIVGGALVDTVGWRAVFLVNVPVGLLAIILTALFVPESRAERPRRIDPGGQGLVVLGLAALIYAIIEAPTAGWLSGQTLGLGILSLAAFIGLVIYERHIRQPLIEMRFFRSAPFAGASAIAVGCFAIQGGFLFLNTLYLQEERGFSPLQAGLCTLPLAVPLLLFAPITGRFIANHGNRVPLLLGPIGLIAGGLMLTGLSGQTALMYLFIAYALIGTGLSLLNPPITNTAVSGMPPAMAGVAAAIASTSRQTGATVGVALFGAIAGGGVAGAVGPGFAQATHLAWWIVVGIATVVLGTGFVTTTQWAERTAKKVAAQIEAQPVSEG